MNTPAPLLSRKPEACRELGGISGSTFYEHIKAGLAPPPIRIGLRMSAWPTDELRAIANLRIAGASDDRIRSTVAEMVAARAARA